MRSSGHEKGDLGKDKSPSVREEDTIPSFV